VGGALLAIKFTAYFLTGSSAVFSDALESIVNVFASAMTVYSIGLAHAPADKKHPYGHGKVEFITAAFEGGMLLAAALVIIFRAVEQLLHGSPVEKADIGVVLMLVATIVNGGLGYVLYRRGKSAGSLALEGSGLHLLADSLTSVAVIVALLLVRFFPHAGWIDPVTGLCVAVYIGIIAGSLMRRSFAGLMDEQDTDDQRMLARLLDAHVSDGTRSGVEPVICSYHKLRHRHSGRYHWVDFHLVVPAHWSIEEGHRIATEIETEIERALGEANATAHVEPCRGLTCKKCPTVTGPYVTKHETARGLRDL
jgi:cation diffusion facilitator family transporter